MNMSATNDYEDRNSPRRVELICLVFRVLSWVLSLGLPSCSDVRVFLSRVEPAVSVIRSIIVEEYARFADSGFDAATFIGRFLESLLRARFGSAVVSRLREGDAVVAVRCREGNSEAAVRVDIVESIDGELSYAVR
jgi:hypothetical protein